MIRINDATYAKKRERKTHMTDPIIPLLPGPGVTPDLEAISKAQEHPTFSCISTGMHVGDDMMFDFRIIAPEDPKVMDWLTFLYLTKIKMYELYEQVLFKALTSYMELDEVDDGIDMEEYLRSRVESYEEDDGLGLRNVSNNGQEG
jgi:hypothetical protein